MTNPPPLIRIRRIVFRHTAGPYPGLRQVMGNISHEGFEYPYLGQIRPHEGPPPDVLSALPMWPDGRISKGMRLKSTDSYVLYQERCEDTPLEVVA